MFQHNGKTTNELINEEAQICSNPPKREHDVLVSTGEQITIAKLCICLSKLGYDAVSYTGWQVPIITDNVFGNARIKKIDNSKIKKDFKSGKIVVVAGFQGIDENLNITTLGRGGSDTTAVAIAASLEADRCEIYTDVDGVYSSDPRIIENVVKIENISYDEMLELASMGAKVLHNRCVEIAKRYNVPIYVKSSFEEESTGTLVSNSKSFESKSISGVTKTDGVICITLNDKMKKMYEAITILSNNNINLDMINYKDTQIKFSIKQDDFEQAKILLDKICKYEYLANLSKISIVGIGISSNPKIIANLFNILYKNNINLYILTSSEIKISFIVDSDISNTTLKIIHDEFIKR